MTTRILHALYTVIGIGVLSCGVLLLSFQRSTPPPHKESPSLSESVVTTALATLPVSIADTPALREKGLSDTASLPPGTGKLFIFDSLQTPGFWMKDMQYPIDIVWITSDWVVAAVTSSVSPESYPSVFYPPTSIQYVLEINAHEAKADGLTPGAQLKFRQQSVLQF